MSRFRRNGGLARPGKGCRRRGSARRAMAASGPGRGQDLQGAGGLLGYDSVAQSGQLGGAPQSGCAGHPAGRKALHPLHKPRTEATGVVGWPRCGTVARSQRVIAAAYGPQISARPAGAPDPRTAALRACAGSCSQRPSAALSFVWAWHPGRAPSGLLPRAGSSPHCRGAGWESPWCRRRPSGWAGATRSRPPGSGRGRLACVSPGAGCPRWPPGCWSGS